jgi:hypothetical protein
MQTAMHSYQPPATEVSRALLREQMIADVMAQLPYDFSMAMGVVRTQVAGEVERFLFSALAGGASPDQVMAAASSVAAQIAANITKKAESDKQSRNLALERATEGASWSACGLLAMDISGSLREARELTQAQLEHIAGRLPEMFGKPEDIAAGLYFVEEDGVLYVRVALDDQGDSADVLASGIRMLDVQRRADGSLMIVERTAPRPDFSGAVPSLAYTQREITLTRGSFASWLASDPQLAQAFEEATAQELGRLLTLYGEGFDLLLDRFGQEAEEEIIRTPLTPEQFLQLSGQPPLSLEMSCASPAELLSPEMDLPEFASCSPLVHAQVK